MVIEPIVQRLIERQVAEAATSAAFALRLGITGAAWSLIRRGKRRPGRTIVDAALRLYPELSYSYVTGLTKSNGDAD